MTPETKPERQSVSEKESIKRFLKFVRKTPKCWIWTGACHGRNEKSLYGQFYFNNKVRLSHRVSHSLFNGNVKKGLVVHHLCNNTLCVNPKHLKAVTQKENILLGTSPSAIHAKKTHCPKGHPYSGNFLDKSRYRKMINERRCIICVRRNSREYERRKRMELKNA